MLSEASIDGTISAASRVLIIVVVKCPVGPFVPSITGEWNEWMDEWMCE